MNLNQVRTHCSNFVGKSVTVRHSNGRMYHGVLHSVTNEGIILRPMPGARPVSEKGNVQPTVSHAIANEEHPTDAEPVWWGAWFLIAFALIAGLWAWGGGWGGYGRGRYGAVGPGYGGYAGGYRGGWSW